MNKYLRAMLYGMSYRANILDRTLFNVYPFMHEPHQLKYLLECIDKTSEVPGVYLEIGCAYGATTAFLKKYMDRLGIKHRYIAIDTFSGFTDDDVEHEIRIRNKSPRMREIFSSNKREWVQHSLDIAGVREVELVERDCTKYDYSSLGGIAFCLIDVDLYKPVLATLEMIYRELSPGGIVVVDDCQPHDLWDGALQAYNEFVEEKGMPKEICSGKYGVIRK